MSFVLRLLADAGRIFDTGVLLGFPPLAVRQAGRREQAVPTLRAPAFVETPTAFPASL